MSIQRGGTLSFRLPSNLPEDILTYLNHNKHFYGRKFSSMIANKLVKLIESEIQLQEQQEIKLILSSLSNSEREWISKPENQQILIKFVMQTFQRSESNSNIPVPNPEQHDITITAPNKSEEVNKKSSIIDFINSLP